MARFPLINPPPVSPPPYPPASLQPPLQDLLRRLPALLTPEDRAMLERRPAYVHPQLPDAIILPGSGPHDIDYAPCGGPLLLCAPSAGHCIENNLRPRCICLRSGGGGALGGGGAECVCE
jgi:hypothetical protein